MDARFHRFFNTHSIFITLDDKIYKLNKDDLSRELVDRIPPSNKDNPVMVIHKKQFDYAKGYLMKVDNPFRISVDTARDYRDIGFISDQELEEYEKLTIPR